MASIHDTGRIDRLVRHQERKVIRMLRIERIKRIDRWCDGARSPGTRPPLKSRFFGKSNSNGSAEQVQHGFARIPFDFAIKHFRPDPAHSRSVHAGNNPLHPFQSAACV